MSTLLTWIGYSLLCCVGVLSFLGIGYIGIAAFVTEEQKKVRKEGRQRTLVTSNDVWALTILWPFLVVLITFGLTAISFIIELIVPLLLGGYFLSLAVYLIIAVFFGFQAAINIVRKGVPYVDKS